MTFIINTKALFKPSWKVTFCIMTFVFAVFAVTTKGQSSEKTVALKVTADTQARYLGIAKNGDMSIESTKIGNLQVFVIVDSNGGELAEGDEVQIKQVGSNGKFVKFLHEKGETISRTSKPDQSSHFKVKKTAIGILFQTASGKFIAAKSITAPLALSDTTEKALVFEVVENPKQ